jgi:hypothetical protein
MRVCWVVQRWGRRSVKNRLSSRNILYPVITSHYSNCLLQLLFHWTRQNNKYKKNIFSYPDSNLLFFFFCSYCLIKEKGLATFGSWGPIVNRAETEIKRHKYVAVKELSEYPLCWQNLHKSMNCFQVVNGASPLIKYQTNVSTKLGKWLQIGFYVFSN